MGAGGSEKSSKNAAPSAAEKRRRKKQDKREDDSRDFHIAGFAAVEYDFKVFRASVINLSETLEYAKLIYYCRVEESNMRIVQLWSNSDETEFAIRLFADRIGFRASTNERADFVKVVDETYATDDEYIDWPFMLAKWISSWKEGFRHTALAQELKLHEAKSKVGHGFATALVSREKRKARRPKKKKRRKAGRMKLDVKCDFCNLMFYDDAERLAHQREWHKGELLKSK
jgi:hypothetical protein